MTVVGVLLETSAQNETGAIAAIIILMSLGLGPNAQTQGCVRAVAVAIVLRAGLYWTRQQSCTWPSWHEHEVCHMHFHGGMLVHPYATLVG